LVLTYVDSLNYLIEKRSLCCLLKGLLLEIDQGYHSDDFNEIYQYG
jgi:hypothetical protein